MLYLEWQERERREELRSIRIIQAIYATKGIDSTVEEFMPHYLKDPVVEELKETEENDRKAKVLFNLFKALSVPAAATPAPSEDDPKFDRARRSKRKPTVKKP